MGQVALGLRSLVVRLAVFVVLAALLAWVLGGTLFPSPQRVNFPAWEFAGSQWNWRVSGSGSDAGATSWTLFERLGEGDKTEQRFGIDGVWSSVWGPRFDGGEMLLGVAAKPSDRDRVGGSPSRAASPSNPEWWLVRVSPVPPRRAEASRFATEHALLQALGPASSPAPE